LTLPLCSQLVYDQPTTPQDLSEACPPVETWQPLHALGPGIIYSAAYRPDGMRLAVATPLGVFLGTAGDDGLALTRLLPHPGGVTRVAWSPDGTRIAGAARGSSVQVWDAATGGLLHRLSVDISGIYAVAWSPDGSKIAGGGFSRVHVWDEAGTLIRTWTGPLTPVLAVAWSPDGSRLVGGFGDGTVRIWDVNQDAPL